MDEDIEDNNNSKDAKVEEGGLVQTDNTPRAPIGKSRRTTWVAFCEIPFRPESVSMILKDDL